MSDSIPGTQANRLPPGARSNVVELEAANLESSPIQKTSELSTTFSPPESSPSPPEPALESTTELAFFIPAQFDSKLDETKIVTVDVMELSPSSPISPPSPIPDAPAILTPSPKESPPRQPSISPIRSQSFPSTSSPPIVIVPNFRHSTLPALNAQAQASSPPLNSRQSLVNGTTSPSFRPSGTLSPEPVYYRSNSMDGPYPSIMSNTSKVKGKAREEENRASYTFLGASNQVGDRDSMVGVGRNSLGSGMMGTLAELPPATPDSTIKVGLPPHLIQQPEICVECMMRDRDMIDIDVTSPGIWDRVSDVDLEEWEDEGGSGLFCTSEERSSKDSHSGSRASTSLGSARRRAKGQSLTTASLKTWTSMNIPASSHRWRTLQVYLANQLVLVEIERQARIDSGATSSSYRTIGLRQSTSGLNESSSSPPNNRKRASTVGLVERDLRAEDSKSPVRSSRSGEESRPQSTVPPRVKDYSSGDQPWLSASQGRRSSAPMLNSYPYSPSTKYNDSDLAIPIGSIGHSTARPGYSFRSSTTDLGSSRYDSQGRRGNSDGRRTSLWSRFRQSASQSMLSLAPSGSMMDMHLGLSMDKHAMNNAPYGNYAGESDPAIARHIERERSSRIIVEEKKKKKGFRGLLSKLMGEIKSKEVKSSPSTPQPRPYYQQLNREFNGSDAPLSPPPPIPAIFSEPGPRYHSQRPTSLSSVDSFPQPQLIPGLRHPRSASVPLGSASSSPQTPNFPPQFSPEHYSRRMSGVGDRSSIITTGSGRSSRFVENLGKMENSSPELRAPSLLRSDSDSREILSSEKNATGVRKEKSLPSIPRSNSPPPPMPVLTQSRNRNTFYSQHASSTHSIRSPSLRSPSPSPGLILNNIGIYSTNSFARQQSHTPEPVILEIRAKKVKSKIFPTNFIFKKKSKFKEEEFSDHRVRVVGEY